MGQIAIKLPDELLAAIDQLVVEGLFASRSAAVRTGLALLASKAAKEAIDDAFRRGFSKLPESNEELAEARRLAIESIEDEPWERWW